jgi:hypothetical protein
VIFAKMNKSEVYINRENVLKLFEYDSKTNKSQCLVPNCATKLTGKVIGNLKRHVILRHQNVIKTLNFIEQNNDSARKRNFSQSFDENSSDTSASCSFTDGGTATSAKRPTIKKSKLDENRFLKGCIKLCTEENVPFRLFNSEAFRMITDPLTDAFGISINAANMPDKISNAADKIRSKITDELKDTLFSIKVDAATKLERGLLGINAQFLKDGVMQIRTLGVIELIHSHTGKYLKSKLEQLLDEKYGLSTVQVYSVTTDNGANMVKAVSLLEMDQQQILLLEQMDMDFEQFIEGQDEFYVDVAEKLELETDSTVLNCVRCVAHTLQLVVCDVAKTCKSELKIVRDFVKLMKTSKFRERFALTSTSRPLLDVVTRWMSTYLMMKNLLDNMPFYKDLSNDPNIDVELPANIQDFIQKYVSAFAPLYFATKCFQEEQLTMGKYFFEEFLRLFFF